jgi:hypothetical protein
MILMKQIKIAIRTIVLILLITLAVFGVGLTGNFLNNQREKYLNNEIKTEKTKEDDEEDDNEEVKT